jgi:hypothetical protein
MNVTLVAFVPGGTGPPAGAVEALEVLEARVLVVDVTVVETVEVVVFAGVASVVPERWALPQPPAPSAAASRSAGTIAGAERTKP